MNRILRKYLLLFILFTSNVGGRLMAQNPLSKAFTTENGLPSNDIYQLLSDRNGYLWIATDGGLCRYDGYTFKTYYNEEQVGKAVSFLYEDDLGRIWCGNFGGRILYIEHDTLKLFQGYKENSLINLAFDKEAQMLYSESTTGIFQINTKDLSFKKLDPPNSNDKLFFTPFCLEKNKILFNSTKPRIYDNGRIIDLKLPPSFKSHYFDAATQTQFYYYRIAFHFHGNTYILNSKSDDLFLLKGDSLVLFKKDFLTQFGSTKYTTIHSYNDKLYIGYYNRGAYLLNSDFSISNEMSSPLYADESITDICNDFEGNVWLATFHGLRYIPNTTVIKHEIFALNMIDKNITALEAFKNDKVIIGNENGKVLLYNTLTQKIEKELDFNQNKKINFIRWEKEKHLVIIGSDDLIILDDNDFHLIKQCATSSLKDFDIDDEYNFFIATPTGLNMLPGVFTPRAPKRNPFLKSPHYIHRFYPDEKKRTDTLESIIIKELRCNYLVYSAKKELVWGAFNEGLYSFKEGKSNRLQFEGQDIYVRTMLNYHDELICGTTNNGVLIFNDDKVYLHLTKAMGLQSNAITKVLVKNDLLFILTDMGVDVYDLQSGRLLTHSELRQIQIRNVPDFSVNDSQIILAFQASIIIIPIRENKKAIVNPGIFINSFMVNEHSRAFQEAPFELENQENNITISFNGLSFLSGENLKYKYRLLGGTDTSWLEIGKYNNVLRFTNLPWGQYEFEVKSISVDGLESQQTKKIRFNIAKPFYLKIWFILTCILLIAFSVFILMYIRGVIRQRENDLKLAKAKIETELRQSQLSSLKVQMNPHFIFNALNSIQDFIFSNDKNNANAYLGKFSDLMRITLDMSQEDKVSLTDELKSINLYLELENIRFSHELEYTIIVDPNIDSDQIFIPPLLVQPYIENALKHGLLHKKSHRVLLVQFSYNEANHSLCCCIDDNGIGREKSQDMKRFNPQRHRSFATSATQKRLELLNSSNDKAISVNYTDKKDNLGNSLGTKVEIEISL